MYKFALGGYIKRMINCYDAYIVKLISFGSSKPSDTKFVKGSTSGITLGIPLISWIEIYHQSYKT